MNLRNLFLMLLGIAFIVLKLCDVIAWSWILVLSPLFAIPIIWVVMLFIAVVWLVKSKETPPQKTYKSKWEEKLEEIRQAQKEREANKP